MTQHNWSYVNCDEDELLWEARDGLGGGLVLFSGWLEAAINVDAPRSVLLALA